MSRYVPKTYYNQRIIRIIVRVVITVSLAVVIIFIALFFSLKNYVVYNPDGTLRLEIPWLMDEQTTTTEP